MDSLLIDTDVLIDFLRGRQDARDFLLKAGSESKLIISVINVMEIYSGKDIKDCGKKKIIENFLSDFEVVGFDENLAKEAGGIRLDYQIPFADAIIAATALKFNTVLITRNSRHFSKVENLKTQCL